MAWLLVLLTIFLLWMLSLWKVLYSSKSTLSNVLTYSNDKGFKRQNVLLVLAHPDDESMFFSPTIQFFISKGHNIHILCMSTGNADGKGYIRKEELYRVCAILKVPPQRVKVLDHPNLQDGLKEQWQHNLLATIIGEEVNMREIDKIITFDSHGVSGHQNHRDVHHGLCMLLQEKRPEVEAWELISTSILRKYSGPVDIWLSIFYSLYWTHGQACCLLNTHPRKCYLAMAEHKSQWVWFRKLFVMFSSYTYVNTLRKINL